jgi:hypothetical protein
MPLLPPVVWPSLQPHALPWRAPQMGGLEPGDSPRTEAPPQPRTLWSARGTGPATIRRPQAQRLGTPSPRAPVSVWSPGTARHVPGSAAQPPRASSATDTATAACGTTGRRQGAASASGPSTALPASLCTAPALPLQCSPRGYASTTMGRMRGVTQTPRPTAGRGRRGWNARGEGRAWRPLATRPTSTPRY